MCDRIFDVLGAMEPLGATEKKYCEVKMRLDDTFAMYGLGHVQKGDHLSEV